MQSVRDSLVYNNLIYHNFAGGIACFADYAGPEWGCQNNRFLNNTVYFKPNEGRYGLQFLEGSRGNLVRNNILIAGRGPALEFDAASGAPDSDANLLYTAAGSDRLVAAGEESGLSLSTWQERGRDRSSLSAGAEAVFTRPDAAQPDFRLAPRSPARAAGVSPPGI